MLLRSDKKVNRQNARHQYDTLISSKTEIVGDLNFTGGLHIDGKVKGSVIAEEDPAAVVRISDHGVIEGEVRAPHVIINGHVLGDVYSSEHIELAENASVSGTVHYNLIEMVMGAQVNGSLVHQGRELEAANQGMVETDAAEDQGEGLAEPGLNAPNLANT